MCSCKNKGFQSHFNQRFIYIIIAVFLFLKVETKFSERKVSHTYPGLIFVTKADFLALLFIYMYEYLANDAVIGDEKFLSSGHFSDRSITLNEISFP